MATSVDIIARIKTIAEGLGYRAFTIDISEKDLADTQLPALIVSNIQTEYPEASKLSRFGWVETYNIGLIIKLEASSNNLSSLEVAQRALIVALQADSTLRSLCVHDSIQPRSSNASNAIAQHSPNGSKLITCILNITCQTVQGV